MDRFKFRLWDNDNEGYDYIDFRDLSRTNEILTTYEEYFYNGYFERNQDCIEQCTGLKDKNGNLIYEGDIVKGRLFNPWHNETPNPKIKGVVCFIQDRMTWIVEDGEDGYDFEDCMEEYFEIIGNIHEQKDNK